MKLVKLALAMSAILPFMAMAAPQPDPDDDGDGISNYEDYCPTTPSGRKVWQMDDFRHGRVPLEWVGCAGNGDTNVPGYHPPQRPPEPPQVSAELAQVRELWKNGQSFDFDAYLGWWTGRCWEGENKIPDNSMLWLVARDVDGPAFPLVKKFGTLYEHYSDPDYWDNPESDEDRRETQKFINEFYDDISPIEPADPGYLIEVSGFNEPWSLRRSADNQHFVLNRNRPEQDYCYYFKKIL